MPLEINQLNVHCFTPVKRKLNTVKFENLVDQMARNAEISSEMVKTFIEERFHNARNVDKSNDCTFFITSGMLINQMTARSS